MSKTVGRRKREVEGQVVPFLRKLQTDTHGPEMLQAHGYNQLQERLENIASTE